MPSFAPTCLAIAALHLGAAADLAELEARCEAGEAEACLDACQLLPQDPTGLPEAARLSRRGCELGSATACAVLGWFLNAGLDPADPTRGLETIRKGCRLGDGGSCGLLGLRLSRGDHAPRDAPGAVAAWERGCLLGDGGSCRDLAGSLADGIGVRRDAARAADLFGRLCDPEGRRPDRLDLLDALSCARLALLTARGDGVPNDPFRAVKLYRYACGAASVGGAEGCYQLGRATLAGHLDGGVAEALRLFDDACAKRHAEACAAAEQARRAARPEGSGAEIAPQERPRGAPLRARRRE